MNTIDIRALRKVQLYIVEDVKRVCNKYCIGYFLSCGSMLGAVRHRGYIPWDDDIDIGMSMTDYRRFLEIAPDELDRKLYIDNYESNPDCALVFTKVRMKNTRLVEAKGNKSATHNEIFVDIFPYYHVSDNRIVRKAEAGLMSVMSQALFSKAGYKVWAGEGFAKRIKFLPVEMVGAILSKKYMHKVVDGLINKYKSTGNLSAHCGSSFERIYFPKEIFQDYIDAEFEGELFKIPKKFDEYLTNAYGDYMELPPEEKRITHMIEELTIGDDIYESLNS